MDLADSQLDALDGEQVQPSAPEPKQDRSAFETFKGTLDAINTMGSEVAASGVGSILGTVEGITESIIDGTYGSAEGVQQLRDTIQARGDVLRYQPRTEAGQEQLAAVGEALSPLADPKYAALAAAIPTAPIGRIPGAVSAAAVKTGGQMAGEAIADTAEKAIRMLPGRGEDAPDTGVGAAEADGVQAIMLSAREFGFEGDAAPTVGQATRDADQLRFENEVVKEPRAHPFRSADLTSSSVWVRCSTRLRRTITKALYSPTTTIRAERFRLRLRRERHSARQSETSCTRRPERPERWTR